MQPDTKNKQIVLNYMEGFRRGDHPMILDCLTEDVEWELPGTFHVRGREEFDRHIEGEGFTGKPVITVTRLIEERDVVAAEGTVRTQRTDGTVLELVFCDLFEMRGGKIKKLVSYLMNAQPARS